MAQQSFQFSGPNHGSQVGYSSGIIVNNFYSLPDKLAFGAERTEVPRQRLQDELNQKCLYDLRLSDPRDDKTRIKNKKGGLLSKASSWILSHKDFLKWQDGDASLLWIKGDPGKGKTMLLMTIVEELERQLKESECAIALSYFFCQGTNQDLNNATAILRGLIYLLVLQRPTLIDHLRTSYDHAGSDFFRDVNSFVALSKVLEAMLLDKSLSRVYLIVDALDECGTNRTQLIDLILHHTSASPHIQWIVSSRNRPEIERYLKIDGSRVRLGLETRGNAEQVSRAVGAYIDEKISELQLMQGEYDLNEIRNILREKANGTFLWVSSVFTELRKASSWEIMDVIEEMPPTLEELYDRMIEQIQNLQRRSPKFCWLVLSTAALACRPLHLAELAVLSDLPEKVSANITFIRELVAMCGSFLTIQDDFVYIIHQSAQDYLSIQAAAMLFPKGHEAVHRRMFWRSLLIMQETLRRDIYILRDTGVSMNQIKNPEPDPLISIRYSYTYWVSHFYESYHTSDLQNQWGFGKLVYNFFRQSCLLWLEALSF